MYKISLELRHLLKDVCKELNEAGITGGLYFYKRNECSCCYGLDNVDFEINGNIPGNWGIYGDDKGYHKVNFTSGKGIGEKVIKVLMKHLYETGNRVEWDWSDYHCIMIYPIETKE
jgi:hypothetical protein